MGIAATQNIDLNALNIQAKNLTLIANNGDVLVNTQIKNSNINNGNAGGSLNLYAKNDIQVNWVPGVNDVSIGEATLIDLTGKRTTTPFAHDLKLTAARNIDIRGAVYLKGDLILRADASLAEATTIGAPMAVGDGIGGVNISYNPNASQPLEIKADSIVIGGKVGTTNYPVQFLRLDASTGTTAVATGNTTVRKDVQLVSDSTLDIYLAGSGGPGTSFLQLIGGSASATSAAGQVAKATAFSGLEAGKIRIEGLDSFGHNDSSILIQGGTSSGNNIAGGGALALTDAVILAKSSKSIDIGGDLVMKGGAVSRVASATLSAGAQIDPATLNITVGGNMVLQGGLGAGAEAKIVNEGEIVLRIGGTADYTYMHTVDGAKTVGPGLIFVGAGAGTGIFNGLNVQLNDNALPVDIAFTGIGGGRVQLLSDPARAVAYIQTGVKGFDTSLLNYLIFAANEETKASRLRTGAGGSDDSNLPSCN